MLTILAIAVLFVLFVPGAVTPLALEIRERP